MRKPGVALTFARGGHSDELQLTWSGQRGDRLKSLAEDTRQGQRAFKTSPKVRETAVVPGECYCS